MVGSWVGCWGGVWCGSGGVGVAEVLCGGVTGFWCGILVLCLGGYITV